MDWVQIYFLFLAGTLTALVLFFAGKEKGIGLNYWLINAAIFLPIGGRLFHWW